MADNSGLAAAKKAKKDEFYTMRVDIENELFHYAEYFRGKVVYCNCDDPESSEFWRFFVRNFRAYGLKKLVATHFEPDERNYSYSLELSGNDLKPTKRPLPCNGDFRSAACIELLQAADIVVTNPPFSLFREFVAQLVEYDKLFIIIGNLNAVTYKEFFPLIKENKVWMGVSIHSGDREFGVPDDYPLQAAGWRIDEAGRKYIRVKGVRWFTNLDIPQRHEFLDLRGNYYYGNEDQYPHYANFDAIDIAKTENIPSDYDGIMGVPVTFLDKYCPEQFNIIGCADYTGKYGSDDIGIARIGEEWIAKYRAQGGRGHYTANMTSLVYYGPDGEARNTFKRILIQRKEAASK